MNENQSARPSLATQFLLIIIISFFLYSFIVLLKFMPIVLERDKSAVATTLFISIYFYFFSGGIFTFL